MLKLLYFVSVSLVVLCRIYSATYNNKTTLKLEIIKQSLSVNLELANKYTVTKTEKKKAKSCNAEHLIICSIIYQVRFGQKT